MTRTSPLGHAFEAPDPVYTPREDSWLLARALDEAGPWEGARAADAGTGSGVQAVTLAAAGARVVATDRLRAAVEAARANARANAVGGSVHAVQAHLLDPLADGVLDVVACNPPYLPASGALEGPEEAALESGEAGVELSLDLVADLDRVLAPGGLAFLVASTRADVEALEAGLAGAGLASTVVAEESFPFERLQVRRLERA